MKRQYVPYKSVYIQLQLTQRQHQDVMSRRAALAGTAEQFGKQMNGGVCQSSSEAIANGTYSAFPLGYGAAGSYQGIGAGAFVQNSWVGVCGAGSASRPNLRFSHRREWKGLVERRFEVI